jgi:3-hydroxybutyryl-CoA dehydrogenase
MGHGIAQTFALAGFRVNLADASAGALEAARAMVRTDLRELVSCGVVDRARSGEAIRNISFARDVPSAVRDAVFVVESVDEDLGLKRRVFEQLESLTGKETILATNSSTMTVVDIAPRALRPRRLIGMHWWNPAHLMRLVEVIPGPATSKATVDSTVYLAKRLGKVPVVCRARPGFVGNRMQGALMVEAARLLEEGVASAEEIDTVARLTLGARLPFMGPLRMMDFTGTQVVLASARFLQSRLGGRFAPPSLLAKYAREGRLGIKSGAGFYDYTPRQARDVTRRRNRWLVQGLEKGSFGRA